MGGKRDGGSPNQTCHLIVASIPLPVLYSLVNFSGLESLSWALGYPCHRLGEDPSDS